MWMFYFILSAWHLVSLETFDPILLIEKEMLINLGWTFSILLHSEWAKTSVCEPQVLISKLST